LAIKGGSIGCQKYLVTHTLFYFLKRLAAGEIILTQ